MAGIELVRDKQTRRPFDSTTGMAIKISRIALKKGLVTYPGTGVVDGTFGDVISIFPPLIFSKDHVDEMITRLESAIREAFEEMN